jgi:CDP-glycerol glycerophosphotransferase (TagB/SpsB family)
LFEHLRNHPQEGIRPVLFAYDRKLARSLSARFPGDVVEARSWEGFRVFLNASVAITSRGSLMRLFLPFRFLAGRKFFVNLWHGIPLKRLGRQTRDTWETLVRYGIQEFDIWIASSDTERLALAACYDLSVDRIWLTGTPRTDGLFAKAPRPERAGAPLTILYAPTWRDGEEDARFLPFDDLKMDVLEAFLEKTGSRLVLRPHMVERNSASEPLAPGSRIVVDKGDLYDSTRDLLLATDVLVTDYSSIYFDFLALDRPMVFIPYDQERYEAKRGFLMEYDRVAPGPKVTTFKDFLDAVESAISAPARHASDRRRVLDYLYRYQDGDASARIVQKILTRQP